MNGFWQSATDIYTRALNHADPRTQSWFLINSPLPTVLIVALYLVVVKYGPRFMANRKPVNDLRTLIIFYNFMLVIWSVYMFYEFTAVSILGRYSYACQPMDLSNNWLSLRIAECFWWYYFSKIVELMDTMFFILRKKFNQISFLHVYHHSTMPLLMWLCLKYVAGGNCFIVGILNSLIHIFMYSYYGLSAIGPQMNKYLWWKPYLTIAQLVQLAIILVHSIGNRYFNCESYPSQYNYIAIVYCSSLIGLFGNFYYRSYYRKPKRKAGHLAVVKRDPTDQSSGGSSEALNNNHHKHVNKFGVVNGGAQPSIQNGDCTGRKSATQEHRNNDKKRI